MKIASIVFGGGVSTLGMSVVKKSIETPDFQDCSFEECTPSDIAKIKEADIILVSLCWFTDIMDYFLLLKDGGIDPRKKKPLLILGGVNAINYKILKGFFHYIVLGDGEIVLPRLLLAIKNKEEIDDVSIVASDDNDRDFVLATNPIIPAHQYIEQRNNNTARIEIARGCRFKCPFCQLAHTKPYREQPVEVVEHLLRQSPTKAVGLFAPDRTGYRDYDRLESTCRRIGKHNTAEDGRLDMVMKKSVVNKVKFGIEGFSENTRKKFRKVQSNKMLIEGFNHIFNVLKTPKGKPITAATAYMIGDLPGEGEIEVNEFWNTLMEADKFCPGKFTLFLTLNSFSAKPFTPMERAGIHPYNEWNKLWDGRPRLSKMTIASRGGMLGPANRITHAIIHRGDERLTRALFYLSTDGRKIFRDSSVEAGRAVEKLIKMSGVEPGKIWGELDDNDKMPHSRMTIQPLP